LRPLALNVIQKIASYRSPAGVSTVPGRQWPERGQIAMPRPGRVLPGRFE
jgi:hypothetical protein